jgi:1-acyl-sn-glycerol-3-phosphate acyltransferase
MSIPTLGEALPARGNGVSRGLGKAVLKILGWDLEGEVPNLSKCVIIGAPHTSNWDFVVAIAAMLALGLDARWLGKHTIFRPPFGRLMRWLGGVSVDRNARHGVVDQTLEAFAQRDRFVLGVAPEGTRKRVDRWKTGFYHVAQGAGVPIVPAYFDYARKVLGFGPPFDVSGDLEADLKRLSAFYEPFKGKKPEQF